MTHTSGKCRISLFSIDLSLKSRCLLSSNEFPCTKLKKPLVLGLTVMQYLLSSKLHSFFSYSPTFSTLPVFLLLFLSQLQLLHSSIRVWEGAPDCCCVRVAQDVAAEPASADRCRSLRQRECGWLLPESQQQQQQLHQHQERDTVRLSKDSNMSAYQRVNQ